MDTHWTLLESFTSYDNYASACHMAGIVPLTWFEFCRAKENRLALAYTSSAALNFHSAAFEESIPIPLKFGNLSPDLQAKFYLAGAHGAYRNTAEATEVFYEDTPEPIIRSGSEVVLEAFLDGKHYSHILPNASGGSYTPDNMIWTPAPDNLSQGSEPLTPFQTAIYEIRNNQEALSLSHEINSIDLLSDLSTIGSVVAACAVTGGLNAVAQRLSYLYGLGGSQALKCLPQMTELISADITYAAINASIRGSSSAGISIITGNPILGAAIGFVVIDGLEMLGKALNNELSASDAGEFAAKAFGSGALVATCVALPPLGVSMALLNVVGSFLRGNSMSNKDEHLNFKTW